MTHCVKFNQPCIQAEGSVNCELTCIRERLLRDEAIRQALATEMFVHNAHSENGEKWKTKPDPRQGYLPGTRDENVNRSRTAHVHIRLKSYGTKQQMRQAVQKLEKELRLQGFDFTMTVDEF